MILSHPERKTDQPNSSASTAEQVRHGVPRRSEMNEINLAFVGRQF